MLLVKKERLLPPILIEHEEAVDAFKIFVFKQKYEQIQARVKLSVEDQQKFHENYSQLQSGFRRKYKYSYYDILNYINDLSKITGMTIAAEENNLYDKVEKIFEGYINLITLSKTDPVRIGRLDFLGPLIFGPFGNGPLVYGFKEFVYSVPENYTDEQIKLLILAEAEKENEKIDKEQEYFEDLKRKFYNSPSDNTPYDRPRIPEKVRIEVWRRDSGKCARCGSREKLEYDHIVPISKGGSNTARNIELLCEKHNRSKSNNVV